MYERPADSFQPHPSRVEEQLWHPSQCQSHQPRAGKTGSDQAKAWSSLESAGGSSLAGAISKVAPRGTIVMFGNSSIQETPFNLTNFVGYAEARLIAFFIYESGTPASMG